MRPTASTATRKSIPNNGAERAGPVFRPDGRTTMATTFKEMPGAAPDIMRDYDLATLGYSETEYGVEGTATSYELPGRQGHGRSLVGVPGERGNVPHPIRGAPAVGPATVQRHGRRGMAQRVGGYRRRTRLGVLPPSRRGAGPRLGRRVGPEGRHRRGRVRRRHPPQAVGTGAVRRPRAPRRCMVVRHVHPGRSLASAPGRRGTRWARAWWPSTCSRPASPSPPPAW